MRFKKFTILFSLLIILLGLPVKYGSAEVSTGVVLLPFNAENSGNYAVLKDGLRTMLSSRLAAKDGVILLENSLTPEEQDRFSALSLEKRRDIFEKLATDYIAVGKMLAQDKVFLLHLDFFTLNTEQPVSLTMHADNEREIIEGMDKLSQRIVEKVFGHKPPPPQIPVTESSSGVEAFQTEHPDRKYKEEIITGTASVDDNSKFEIVQGDLVRRKSALPSGMTSMAITDGDGDRIDEIFVASANSLRVFRYERSVLQQIDELDFKPRVNIHAMTVADLDGDGKIEIYLSALMDDKDIFSSSVLSWSPTHGFQQRVKNIRWAIRPVFLPEEGVVLAGQKVDHGRLRGNFLEPEVFVLKMGGKGRYVKGKKLHLPEGVGLFEFIIADIDGDGPYEKIAITRDMKLAVYDNENSMVWLSEEDYGGGITHLGRRWQQEEGTSRATGSGDNETLQDLSYIPTRLIAMDVNQDGKTDIITGKNILSSYKWMNNSRSFSGGNVVCMGWDGFKMVELWGTDKLGGYVADYHMVGSMPNNLKRIASGDDGAKNRLKLYVGQVPNDSFANLFTTIGKEANLVSYDFNIIEKSEKLPEGEK